MLYIASDHAGFDLKSQLMDRLREKVEFEDLGTSSIESCDYPEFANQLCAKVLEKTGNLGVLICGSGIGMSIAANKIAGIRAAVVSEATSARLSREHNDANVLCLGGRIVGAQVAEDCVSAFLNSSLDTKNARHQRRLDQIKSLEGKRP